jgi:lipopolysaccharide/colanic/teichoic acid biosynthesis glycosyltransferase
MDAVPALNARLADLAADRIIVLCDTGENGAAEAMELTSRARELGLRASVVMRPLAHMGAGLVSEQVAGSLVLHAPRRGVRELLKRTADVIGSVLGLIALSPVMALFALAIKLDSRGPVFFRQNRTGRDGEEFEVLKFRTMVADAEALKEGLRDANEADGLFKLEHDPRVTRPGRWLRATSLDELPQLLNVLRGQMGLVGPRPLVPEEAGAVAGAHRAMRLSVRPGMTGPWQVMGSARIGISDMGAIDHLYASDGTIAADAKLILRTAGVVVGRRGM